MRGVKIAMKRSENRSLHQPAVRGLPGCGFLEIPDHGLDDEGFFPFLLRLGRYSEHLLNGLEVLLSNVR